MRPGSGRESQVTSRSHGGAVSSFGDLNRALVDPPRHSPLLDVAAQWPPRAPSGSNAEYLIRPIPIAVVDEIVAQAPPPDARSLMMGIPRGRVTACITRSGPLFAQGTY